MLELYLSSRFKKDYKAAIKRGLNKQDLIDVVNQLREQKPLEAKHHDHALTGDYAGFRECHIHPDWLLIYQIREQELILTLARTGSHSTLFGK